MIISSILYCHKMTHGRHFSVLQQSILKFSITALFYVIFWYNRCTSNTAVVLYLHCRANTNENKSNTGEFSRFDGDASFVVIIILHGKMQLL